LILKLCVKLFFSQCVVLVVNNKEDLICKFLYLDANKYLKFIV